MPGRRQRRDGYVGKHPEWARKTKERLESMREKDDKKIKVSEPIIKTNLITRYQYLGALKKAEQLRNKPFDWSPFEDGWNGSGLRINTSIKVKDPKEKVYCHEPYAQSVYYRYIKGHSTFEYGVKDFIEGGIVKIQNVQLLGGDELLISTTTGNAAIVNLAKENRFFAMLGTTKADYKEHILGTPEGRDAFIKQGFLARIERGGQASLYDGLLYKSQQEFLDQIEKGPKANMVYDAVITASNRGGYICQVQGLRCFMPGSQASSNKIEDFDAIVGQTIKVMIMKYIEGTGFLVSHKMYLDRIAPVKIAELREYWKDNPEYVYEGRITGNKRFGVFVELSEFYTGLLHSTYASPQVYARLNNDETFTVGDKIGVVIYDITQDNRIVFSDILDPVARKEIVAEREKVLEAEKAEREAAKEKERLDAQKKMKSNAESSFGNRAISLDELKSNLKK